MLDRFLYSFLLFVTPALHCSQQSVSPEIKVAVASNFAVTMNSLAERFESDSGHTVIVITGSTGKHYAQIRNGAPYDMYFAADVRRPELLEKEGVAIEASRFTYAIGRIVLWSPQPNYVDSTGTVLEQDDYFRLAIANPVHAPYGRAAQEVLRRRGLWEQLSRSIVRGENISQTFHFVRSGNADIGFVAYSQIVGINENESGSFWIVPQTMYSRIEQQAVLLKDGSAARAFLSFVRSATGRQIIHDHGYGTP